LDEGADASNETGGIQESKLTFQRQVGAVVFALAEVVFVERDIGDLAPILKDDGIPMPILIPLEGGPSNDIFLDIFPGLPISTLLAPPTALMLPSSAPRAGFGIMLDFLFALNGPIFDNLLRPPLVALPAIRGVEGTRRTGVPGCLSLFLGICNRSCVFTGEVFSSSSARLPSMDAPFDFKNPGSNRLGLGLLGPFIRPRGISERSEEEYEEERKVILGLSSVFSSSHSLSDPPLPPPPPARISEVGVPAPPSVLVTEIEGGGGIFKRCPPSSKSPPTSSRHCTLFLSFSLSDTRR
jgi:hypothetical protein